MSGDDHDRLHAELSTWLPDQRWFAGKARQLRGVRLVDLAELETNDAGEEIVDAIAEVEYADGGSEQYQLPLRLGGQGAFADAMADPQACRLLAEAATQPRRRPTRSGGALVGAPVTGEQPGAELAAQPLGVEQSNSSVVFGDRYLLKVFRKLELGESPEVELTRTLTEAGFAHVPAQHAALRWEHGSGETALAVLSDFVAGGSEGWRCALDELAEPTPPDAPLQGRVAALGATVAECHAVLAERLGRSSAGPAQAREWAQRLTAQATSVLDRLAAQQVHSAPELAEEVLTRRDAVLTALEHVATLEQAGALLRIHGDLHLGQVLLDPQGSWQLLDFEGEPARPLTDRRAADSPLRDVASMLRSFDYAAHHDRGDDAARRWGARARRDFLAGYESPARTHRLLPTTARATTLLRHAFELDKAVYELGYELGNRPTWTRIPLQGILDLLDAAEDH